MLQLDTGLAVPRHPAMRRRLRWPAHPAVLLPALAVACFALIPAAFVLLVLVQTGWETASALIFRPRVAELLRNTLVLEALAVPLSIALAVTPRLADRAHGPAAGAALGGSPWSRSRSRPSSSPTPGTACFPPGAGSGRRSRSPRSPTSPSSTLMPSFGRYEVVARVVEAVVPGARA